MLQTKFILSATSWADDPSDYPLTYAFLYKTSQDAAAIEYGLSSKSVLATLKDVYMPQARRIQDPSQPCAQDKMHRVETRISNIGVSMCLQPTASNGNLTLITIVTDRWDASARATAQVTVK